MQTKIWLARVNTSNFKNGKKLQKNNRFEFVNISLHNYFDLN